MELSPSSICIFAELLHRQTGQELALSRSWRFETALRPLLKAHGLESLDRLAGIVASGRDPALADAVVDALLNNETSFFRDPAAFRPVLAEALEIAARARAATRRLRIWSAGCATGQEVYSIAMLLAAEPERWAGWTIDLIGTDISGEAIARAREGLYSQFEIQRGLPVREMMRWFEPEEERWRARAPLRGRARFQVGNLLHAKSYPAQADIILCRNVLLYLAADKRRAVFDLLGDALAADGALMLGAGETVLGQTDRFEPDPDRRGAYRHRRRGAAHGGRAIGSAAA